MDPLLHRALAFAARAHHGQFRKDGATPFFSHPARVAMRVALDFGCDDPEVLAAAVLHDVIEDCPCDFDDVKTAFNERIARMVAALSNDPRLPEPDLTEAFYATLEQADWQTRLIKMADTWDNFLDRRGTSNEGRSREKMTKAVQRLGFGEAPPIQRARDLLKAEL